MGLALQMGHPNLPGFPTETVLRVFGYGEKTGFNFESGMGTGGVEHPLPFWGTHLPPPKKPFPRGSRRFSGKFCVNPREIFYPPKGFLPKG